MLTVSHTVFSKFVNVAWYNDDDLEGAIREAERLKYEDGWLNVKITDSNDVIIWKSNNSVDR